jgi:hypothetical protein
MLPLLLSFLWLVLFVSLSLPLSSSSVRFCVLLPWQSMFCFSFPRLKISGNPCGRHRSPFVVWPLERLEGCVFLRFTRVFWCGDATRHSSLPRSAVPLPGFVVWGCHLAFLLPPVFVHLSGLIVWGCHLAFLSLPGFLSLFPLQVLVTN